MASAVRLLSFQHVVHGQPGLLCLQPNHLPAHETISIAANGCPALLPQSSAACVLLRATHQRNTLFVLAARVRACVFVAGSR